MNYNYIKHSQFDLISPEKRLVDGHNEAPFGRALTNLQPKYRQARVVKHANGGEGTMQMEDVEALTDDVASLELTDFQPRTVDRKDEPARWRQNGFRSIATMLPEKDSYLRLPSFLENKYPDVAALQKEDRFGVTDRLRAITEVLRKRNLGTIIDLGGHSGYFPISLFQAGMVNKATVYDFDHDIVMAGRMMVAELGISDRIEFVEKELDLSFLRRMPVVDTVICLNLIHHAGSTFDMDEVERDGWEAYALSWLAEMRSKCRLMIFGLGLKSKKPRHWDVPHAERAKCFAHLAERVGWSVLYDANVDDIHRFGVRGANGRRTKCRNDAQRHEFDESAGEQSKSAETRRKYHFYIFE